MHSISNLFHLVVTLRNIITKVQEKVNTAEGKLIPQVFKNKAITTHI